MIAWLASTFGCFAMEQINVLHIASDSGGAARASMMDFVKYVCHIAPIFSTFV
jgi:hypothetical protein